MTEYSPNDELYKAFGQRFVNALDDAVLTAAGKKSGIPARKLVDELKAYVAEDVVPADSDEDV